MNFRQNWCFSYSSTNGKLHFARKTHLKCVCSDWKNVVIHLSVRINGVDVVPPKPERAGADKSSSRRHGKPLRYGSSCGPRKIWWSAKITCRLKFICIENVIKVAQRCGDQSETYLCSRYFQNNNRTTFASIKRWNRICFYARQMKTTIRKSQLSHGRVIQEYTKCRQCRWIL